MTSKYIGKRLTRFELARVLGARSLQLTYGAPVLTKITGNEQPIDIARKEFSEGKIPMVIVRVSPDGTKERLELSDTELIESALM